MAQIPIKDLQTVTIEGEKYLVLGSPDGVGLAGKTKVSSFINFISGLNAGGFEGALAIADTPTEDGVYFPSESGTYTNADDIVVDLSAGFVVITKSGINYEVITYPIDLLGYLTDSDISTTGPKFGSDKLPTDSQVLSSINSNIETAKAEIQDDYEAADAIIINDFQEADETEANTRALADTAEIQARQSAITNLQNQFNTLEGSTPIFQGSISASDEFPTSADVQTGWEYQIAANVTDNNATKTNTGESFAKGQRIRWGANNTWSVTYEEPGVQKVNGKVGDVIIDSDYPIRLPKSKNAIVDVANNAGNFFAVYQGDSIAKTYLADDVVLHKYRNLGFRSIFCNPTNALGVVLYSISLFGSQSGTTIEEDDWEHSFTGKVFEMTGSGNYVRTFIPPPIKDDNTGLNKAKVLYKTSVGGGSFTVKEFLNGDRNNTVTLGTVDTDASAGLAVTEFDLASGKNAEVSIEWVSGTVRVVGVLLENTAVNGFGCAFLDEGGIDMEDINTMPQANVDTTLDLLRPDLLTWSMKDNQPAVPKLDDFYTRTQSAWASDFLVIVPYPDDRRDTQAEIDSDILPIRQWAIDNNVDYYNTLQDVPSYQYGVNQGWFADSTHLNTLAGRILSSRLWRATGLLPDYNGYKQDKTLKKETVHVSEDFYIKGSSIKNNLESLNLQNIKDAGIIFKAGSFGKAFNLVSFGNVGTDDVLMFIKFRMPPVMDDFQLLGIRSVLGGSGGDSLELSIKNDNQSQVSILLGDEIFNSGTAHTYLESRLGEIVNIAVVRNNNLDNKIILSIDGKSYQLSNLNNYENTNIDAGNLKIGSQNTSLGEQDFIVYQAGMNRDSYTIDEVNAVTINPQSIDFETFADFTERRGLLSGKSDPYKLDGVNWASPFEPVVSIMKNAGTNNTINRNDVAIANFNSNSNPQNFTLPSTPKEGDLIEVEGFGQGKWIVKQPALHQILTGAGTTVGVDATTIGIGGSLTATERYDCVTLRCVSVSIGVAYKWVIKSKTGTLTFV